VIVIELHAEDVRPASDARMLTRQSNGGRFCTLNDKRKPIGAMSSKIRKLEAERGVEPSRYKLPHTKPYRSHLSNRRRCKP
jgi:hypothetical protein